MLHHPLGLRLTIISQQDWYKLSRSPGKFSLGPAISDLIEHFILMENEKRKCRSCLKYG